MERWSHFFYTSSCNLTAVNVDIKGIKLIKCNCYNEVFFFLKFFFYLMVIFQVCIMSLKSLLKHALCPPLSPFLICRLIWWLQMLNKYTFNKSSGLGPNYIGWLNNTICVLTHYLVGLNVLWDVWIFYSNSQDVIIYCSYLIHSVLQKCYNSKTFLFLTYWLIC